MNRKSMKRIKKKTKPKIRSGTKVEYEATQPERFYGKSKRIVYKKMAARFNVTEQEIKNKMDGYLNAVVQNGGTDHGLDAWYNCDSCGFDKISVCLFGNCCGGSADIGGGGSWEISCARKLGKPKDSMIN